MRTKRNIKDILSQVIEVEEYYERFVKTDEMYQDQFNVDFRVEMAFNLSKVTETQYNQAQQSSKVDAKKPWLDNKKLNNGSFKKIYRELVKKTHPDKNEETQEEFKEISEAYRTGDMSTIIKSAAKYDVDINATEFEVDKIKSDMDMQIKYIAQRKNSAAWYWYFV